MKTTATEAVPVPTRPPDHFEFRDGYSYPIGPDVIGAELVRLGRPNGGLVYREDVIEASRDPAHPFHGVAITWDPARGLAKCQAQEAIRLMRSVVPVFVAPDARKLSTNPWMVPVVTADNRRAHAPMEVVVETPSYREQSLRDARHGLDGWRRRLEGIEGAAAICRAIALACRALDRLAEREKARRKGKSGPRATV